MRNFISMLFNEEGHTERSGCQRKVDFFWTLEINQGLKMFCWFSGEATPFVLENNLGIIYKSC